MIYFKQFVEAIHQAIIHASDSLADKNKMLFDTYFEEDKNALIPKTVKLGYPALDDQGNVVTTTVQIPLIALVPMSSSKIEKATISAEFELEVVNDELQINFPNKKNKNENATLGKLEIIISPQETSEGLDLIIEGYANAIKRQIT